MSNLETTNVLLIVIATATAAQFLMFLFGALWVKSRVTRLEDSVTHALKRFEALEPDLAARVNGLVQDVKRVAERVDRVGVEVERATRIVQGILNIVGAEVDRAFSGVRLAFDVVEGGVRQATRVGAGVRAGLRELFTRPENGQQRREDEDAIARFEAKA